VRCTGATLLLRIAQPDDGWRVEVDKSGPEEVRLRFLPSDDNAGSGTRVTTFCSAGTPAFSVDNKG
jgi:hypothetical protein